MQDLPREKLVFAGFQPLVLATPGRNPRYMVIARSNNQVVRCCLERSISVVNDGYIPETFDGIPNPFGRKDGMVEPNVRKEVMVLRITLMICLNVLVTRI